MKLAGAWYKREISLRQILIIAVIVCTGFGMGAYGMLYGQPAVPVLRQSVVHTSSATGPSGESLPIRGAEQAAGNVEIRNPFSSLHEKKQAQGEAPLSVTNRASRQEKKSPRDQQLEVMRAEALTIPQHELRLTGILSGTEKRMALLSWQGEQFSLSPGEEKKGIYLISVDGNEALIRDAYGERILQLKN
jgi:hypothetical protein